MSTFIVGIDPGKSLGIAIMNFPDLVAKYQGDLENGIVFLKEQLELMKQDNADIYVAIERFTINAGTGRKPGATKIAPQVGRLESIAREYPVKGVYIQSVSDASRYSNDFLRKVNLYVKASDVGCKDAND